MKPSRLTVALSAAGPFAETFTERPDARISRDDTSSVPRLESLVSPVSSSRTDADGVCSDAPPRVSKCTPPAPACSEAMSPAIAESNPPADTSAFSVDSEACLPARATIASATDTSTYTFRQCTYMGSVGLDRLAFALRGMLMGRGRRAYRLCAQPSRLCNPYRRGL